VNYSKICLKGEKFVWKVDILSSIRVQTQLDASARGAWRFCCETFHSVFSVASFRYKRQNTSEREVCKQKIIKIVYAVFKFRLDSTVRRGTRISQSWTSMDRILGCVSLRKSKIGFLNPNESENGFCVSLLTRYDQINPRYLGSWCVKGPMDPLSEWILRKNPFSNSFGFKNPILNFLKETHS